MEILKRGNEHERKATGWVECSKCKSELSVKRSDFTVTDPRELYAMAPCPVCGLYLGRCGDGLA